MPHGALIDTIGIASVGALLARAVRADGGAVIFVQQIEQYHRL